MGLLHPRWKSILGFVLTAGILGCLAFTITWGALAFPPGMNPVGYEPLQPVAFSHAVHAGDLGVDCRYCHGSAETAGEASLPSTRICMTCHANVLPESASLLPVRESMASGIPIRWVRVNVLPDHVHFSHAVHVRRGVGCVSCHDRVDQVERASQATPLSMGWCLACHADPDPFLRPLEQIFRMDWVPKGDPRDAGAEVRKEWKLDPPEDCDRCHR